MNDYITSPCPALFYFTLPLPSWLVLILPCLCASNLTLSFTYLLLQDLILPFLFALDLTNLSSSGLTITVKAPICQRSVSLKFTLLSSPTVRAQYSTAQGVVIDSTLLTEITNGCNFLECSGSPQKESTISPLLWMQHRWKHRLTLTRLDWCDSMFMVSSSANWIH